MLSQRRYSGPATNHGIIYEDQARRGFASKFNKNVRQCGFFIDENFPFLGASPDGFIAEENGILEIKCPYEGRNDMVTVSKKFPYLEIRQDRMCLKKSHPYYYQVQGQLNISKTSHCYFIIHTHVDCLVEKIHKDEDFYEYAMLPKLIAFYEGFFREEAASALISM